MSNAAAHQELEAIKTLIYQHAGLLLEGLAAARLSTAVQRLRQQHACGRGDYWRRLQQEPDLLQELISQLTVNETYFFREVEYIRLFIDQLIPRVLAQAEHRPLRILSAGCSSGEEAYSLLLALHEAYPGSARSLFHVAGGDIDQQVLAKARQARYAPFSFRGVSAAVQQRYFQPQGSYWQLLDQLKQQVVFFELNLVAPPQITQPYDVVFFRNVSIYFDAPTRHKILRHLSQMMAPNSLLIMGSSETLGNDLGVFSLVEEQGLYYFVQGQALRPALTTAAITAPAQTQLPTRVSSAHLDAAALGVITLAQPQSQPQSQPIRPPIAKMEPSPAAPYSCTVDLKTGRHALREAIQQEAWGLARQCLQELISIEPCQDLGVAVLAAWLEAQNQHWDAAQTWLDQVLEQQPWSVDGLFIQALVYRWQERTAEAEQQLKQLVYIQPECWPAQYYLAEVYRQRQQWPAARRALHCVVRLLKADPAHLGGFSWLPPALPAGDVLRLSQAQLNQLSSTARGD
ncbi:CheR family methyltransferase [Marinospirillum sp. MEB164]|uniref:CheR family methyltransferase n=1 Tax=Marinospirillum alkalitolerans TaxID=3123374 RepID=A0ABW8PWU7_9GAMM